METKTIQRAHNQIKFDTGEYCYITHSISNCKLTELDYISSLNLNKEMYDKVFKQCRILISANTQRKDILDWIKANYEVYDVAIAPVGYATTENQYHILIRNPFLSGDYSRPVPEKKEIDVAKIKESLIKAFKQKRRKTDLIEQLL